ncbi:wee1-like protein kinase [Vitis riparia]|uniref:wee1-like protein kinase n=1 Tax=Vitis riparia TaxID=96939 RepID=UPI00155A2F9C|nr:wee1-like protein kinase [Vitis riparia]
MKGTLGRFHSEPRLLLVFFPALVGGDGLSRYHTDFHEIEVLKRIDGCMYAVKHSTRPLHQDTERRKALMEVQALAALGSHEMIFSVIVNIFSLEIYLHIAKALQFTHEKGIAHLDVKPDNIYVKDGVYKLGDFGCATLLDRSLSIDEGDARYMPQEILNDKYDHLDNVDMFSLGAAIYELIRGSHLPESRYLFLNLREGKLLLLPGYSLQFQNLLKAMQDPDPVWRPSAKELVENPIFDRLQRNAKTNKQGMEKIMKLQNFWQ